MTDAEVLQAYLDRHNEGVESGDFRPMLELFAPDAELLFVAIHLGPFRGIRVIAQAFQDHPSSDKLKAHDPPVVSLGASVVYEWAGNPGTNAGVINALIGGGKIVRMVVYFDAKHQIEEAY